MTPKDREAETGGITGQPYRSPRGHSLRVEVGHCPILPHHPATRLHQRGSQSLPRRCPGMEENLCHCRSCTAFLLLWGLSCSSLLWLPDALGPELGAGARGFPFPKVASSKILLLFGPQLAICLLPGMGSKTRSLPPCRSCPPLIRPFGLLGRRSMSSIPGPSASGGLPKTKLFGRHPRSLESEFLRMGLGTLHSNRLSWGSS